MFHHSARKLLASLTCLILLTGCEHATHLASDPSQQADATQRLERLTDLDQRVARVAWTLSSANRELCPVTRNSAGWALHSANQYSQELRRHAVERFQLEGDLPGILSAPQGSPAWRAGLRSGDLIVRVNRKDLRAGQPNRPAQYQGLASNLALLDLALAAGPVDLTVRRAGQPILIALTPSRACGYDVQLNPSNDLHARADGRRLFISTALAQFTETDDELALVLGHELAHNVLGHRSWAEAGGEGRTVVERECDARLCEDDPEQQADRVGLFLMARAGYAPQSAAPFWRRYGAANWRVRYPQLSHASAETRARRLEAVQLEIETLSAGGKPLLP